jgi:hypothetical protein
MSVKTPHIHAAVIKAWADGAQIETRSHATDSWTPSTGPCWYSDREYRVKPEPKPDSILLRRIELTMGEYGLNAFIQSPNIRFTFDGETKKLKSVEMIKDECA